MFMLYLFNQMILPFPFSSVMFVQKSFKFSIISEVKNYILFTGRCWKVYVCTYI